MLKMIGDESHRCHSRGKDQPRPGVRLNDPRYLPGQPFVCQFIERRQREEILLTLIEGGLVMPLLRPTSTKHALIYRAV